jgi:hypothetical protein
MVVGAKYLFRSFSSTVGRRLNKGTKSSSQDREVRGTVAGRLMAWQAHGGLAEGGQGAPPRKDNLDTVQDAQEKARYWFSSNM